MICTLGEALRENAYQELPRDKESQGDTEQAPGERVRDEHEGGEHHCVIPIIYTAAAAALILHKPSLEGAEEKNADHITYGIRKADDNEDRLINKIGEVKHSDSAVQCEPCERYGKCGLPRLKLWVCVLCGHEIARELLLTSHALEP